MDATRFDSLIRSVTASHSRRGALAALLAGTLALLGLAETAAKKGKSKGKGKKKKKRGDQGTSPPPPPPPTGPAAPPPPCLDGIKNGSESDVDCGGSCPRCLNGRSCGSRDDCASAVCTGGTCQPCATDADCPKDARGQCYCGQPATGGSKVCSTGRVGRLEVASCESCPADTACLDPALSGPGVVWCLKLCGAP
jgi:hypothetical protein